MNRTSTILLYIATAITAGVVFLYLLFPDEAVRRWVVDQARGRHPDIDLQIEHLAPSLIPGLVLSAVKLSFQQAPVAHADTVRLSPALLSLLGKEKRLKFDARIQAGQLKGTLLAADGNGGGHLRVSANLNAFPLEAADVLRRWPAYRVIGRLDGPINFDSRKGLGGTATANLTISDARVTAAKPIMGINQIDITQLKSDLTLTARRLQVKRCDFAGPLFTGKVTGTILFGRPMARSRISLTCTLKPQAGLLTDPPPLLAGLLASAGSQQRTIILRITGTFDQPRYAFR